MGPAAVTKVEKTTSGGQGLEPGVTAPYAFSLRFPDNSHELSEKRPPIYQSLFPPQTNKNQFITGSSGDEERLDHGICDGEKMAKKLPCIAGQFPHFSDPPNNKLRGHMTHNLLNNGSINELQDKCSK